MVFELTNDARTRKIRAGSDLRHNVRDIYRQNSTGKSSMWGSLRLAPIMVDSKIEFTGGEWIPKCADTYVNILLIPGFVCQAVQCGWADCVPVVKGFELIVSQPPLSESLFPIVFVRSQ